jgi:hypothetical protein
VTGATKGLKARRGAGNPRKRPPPIDGALKERPIPKQVVNPNLKYHQRYLRDLYPDSRRAVSAPDGVGCPDTWGSAGPSARHHPRLSECWAFGPLLLDESGCVAGSALRGRKGPWCGGSGSLQQRDVANPLRIPPSRHPSSATAGPPGSGVPLVQPASLAWRERLVPATRCSQPSPDTPFKAPFLSNSAMLP